MKLLRLTTNYNIYLQSFYNFSHNLNFNNYNEHYAALMNDCFGWADFWSDALTPLGYNVWEPVCNAEKMQKQWAEENDCTYHQQTWLLEIAFAQIQQFKPAILFFDDYITFPAEFIQRVRHECPSIQLIVGWCGAPFANNSVFNEYDLILSNIPDLVSLFRSEGLKSELIMHAFAPKIIDKIHSIGEKSISLSFIGSIVKSNKFHNERLAILEKLIDHVQIEIYALVNKPSPREYYSLPFRQLFFHLTQQGNKIPVLNRWLHSNPKISRYMKMRTKPDLSHYLNPDFIARCHPPVFGLDMYRHLSNSKVTFNNHIDLSSKFSSNMRLFESTGVGTCLLTDWSQNLKDLFEPEYEVVTYRSQEEAISKVNYLLHNDDERIKIAMAGQKRTLKDHTFDVRAKQLHDIIQNYLMDT